MTVGDVSTPMTFRSADGRFSVELRYAAAGEMTRHCRASPVWETGGLLVVFYSEDRSLAVVERATGPPADSRRAFATFFRGVRGLQDLLDRLWGRPERLYYLGEWHYHPLPFPMPSASDVAQMGRIAADERYACPEPVLVIVSGPAASGCQFSVTVHPRGRRPIALPQTSADRTTT